MVTWLLFIVHFIVHFGPISSHPSLPHLSLMLLLDTSGQSSDNCGEQGGFYFSLREIFRPKITAHKRLEEVYTCVSHVWGTAKAEVTKRATGAKSSSLLDEEIEKAVSEFRPATPP